MTQKQRTIAALVLLFAVAGTSYAFLEWQAARPVPDVAVQVATSTQATSAAPAEDPVPEAPAPSASDHQFGTVTLRLNEVASFPNGLSMRVASVLEDSRCPENARCIWAGEVRVSVRIRSAMGVSTNEFALGTRITTEAQEIALMNVEPGNMAGKPTADVDYRFTFEVKPRKTEGTAECFVGGCSAQLCTDDPDVASTCEYRAEYACYKTAKCERQPSGKCGWTETSELRSCLRNPPEL
ncbi:MAG: hypothetical protein QOE22_108 [Candidatus Parcubacteria bacterium]|jgi:hypothetical protein|nr:hypothetical protein [Candidatus Parcubacteria bacterium]